ncbi:16S rRNA (cytosine(1402)-N(4))-methyltransferase RsmH [Thalassoroseus pseudoceratinae]|uniref:16S rRNA (cytosine(1402)-N(4))-methyltransferase RsmH n=1 Tax=Thalassoroseus pseudoceratinae TaxID=2713176 RepID=UPI001F1106B6|nr:16S rRNA (cytosine(1402)-N(4))-methyltransferase RsmH [Thalassoroseus pseudoceratinae]
MAAPDRQSQRIGNPVHRPVLLREVMREMELSSGLTVLDGTVGAAGHSQKIWQKIRPDGTLIGLDRDPMMLAYASTKLRSDAADAQRIILEHASYADAASVLESHQIDQVDRVLLDLGLSSDQLASDDRGFSFQATGDLDLRFDPSRGHPAWKMLQNWSETELCEIFEEYGEERYSRRIAAGIEQHRQENSKPLRSAKELTEIVLRSVPSSARQDAKKHPATRVYQALRIAVNQELDHLRQALDETLPRIVRPGGRALIITFHSLEDRMVKAAFRGASWQTTQTGPSKALKPISASPDEVRLNPRARTARLRVAIRA